MRITQSKLFYILPFLLLIHCLPSSAQVATGTPPFGSFGGGPDVINLGNLNAHLTVPVLNKAGRGTPFIYNLTYDSSVWYPVGTSGSQTWTPVYNWGWSGQSQASTGYISERTTTANCYTKEGTLEIISGTRVIEGGWVYHDPWGVPHAFSGFIELQTGTCGSGFSSLNSMATDGSGYTISTPSGPF